MLDSFRNNDHPLPDKPPPEPPPEPPPLSDYCLETKEYASYAAAANLSEHLIDRGILSLVENKSHPARKFIVITLVRADLGVARDLSDLLRAQGIRNTIKENKPFYILHTGSYGSQAEAARVLDRIKRLELSAYLEERPASDERVLTYFARIDKTMVPLLEASSDFASLSEEMGFKRNPDC